MSLTESLDMDEGPSRRSSTRMEKVATILKDTFDPLNIASKLMGRSKFGTAILGSLFGRSGEDIRRITAGEKRNPDYTTLSSGSSSSIGTGDSLADIAAKIYNFMSKNVEDNKKEFEDMKHHREEHEKLMDFRNEALISALLGEGTITTKKLGRARIQRKLPKPKTRSKSLMILEGLGLVGLMIEIPKLIGSLKMPDFIKENDIAKAAEDLVLDVKLPSLEEVWDMVSDMKLPTKDEINSEFNSIKEELKSTASIAGKVGKGIYRGLKKRLLMPDSVFNAIDKASEKTGVSRRTLFAIADAESGLDPKARNPKSSAIGLFQITNDTWKDILKLPEANIEENKAILDRGREDPEANALGGALLIKSNGTDEPKQAYLSLFAGKTGADILSEKNDSLIAADLMPKAAKANQSIYYDKQGRPRTVKEVRDEIYNRVEMRLPKYEEVELADNTPIPTPSSEPIPAQNDKYDTLFNATDQYKEYMREQEEGINSIVVLQNDTENNTVIKDTQQMVVPAEKEKEPALLDAMRG